MNNEEKINVILLELKNSDKYGIEIASSLKFKSSDFFNFKQTQLYNLLKNMEKSLLISSYWKDSEIGGKRHYYTLTNKGKQKLALSPTIDEIITKLSMEKYAFFAKKNDPTDEMQKNIDKKTNYELNKQNNELINNINIKKEESYFADTTLSPIFETKEEKVKLFIEKSNIFDNNKKVMNAQPANKTDYVVSRIDYTNFENNKRMVKHKKTIFNLKKYTFQNYLTQIALLCFLIFFTTKIYPASLSHFAIGIQLLVIIYKLLKFSHFYKEIKYDIYDNQPIRYYSSNYLKSAIASIFIFLILTIILICLNTFNYLNYNNCYIELITIFVISLMPLMDYYFNKKSIKLQ